MDLSLPPPDFGASQPTEQPRSKYLPQILKGLGVADGTKWSELSPSVKQAARQVLRGVALGQSPEEALKEAGKSVARKAVQDAAKQVTSKILSGSNTAQSAANAAVSSLIDGASGKEAVKTAAKTAASKTLGDAADRMVPGSGDVAGKIISGLFEGEDLGNVAKDVGKGLASQVAGKAASSLLSSVPGVGGLASGLVSDLLDDGKVNTGSAVVTGLSAAANLIPGVGTVASLALGLFGGGLASGINRGFFAYSEEYAQNKELKETNEDLGEKIRKGLADSPELAEIAARGVVDAGYLFVKDETPEDIKDKETGENRMLTSIQNSYSEIQKAIKEEKGKGETADPAKIALLEEAEQRIRATAQEESGNYERMVKEQEEAAKKAEGGGADQEQQVAQAGETGDVENTQNTGATNSAEGAQASDRTQQPADKTDKTDKTDTVAQTGQEGKDKTETEGDKTETITVAQAEEEGEKDNKGEKDQQQKITLEAPIITGISGGTVATVGEDGKLVLAKEDEQVTIKEESPKGDAKEIKEEVKTETPELANTTVAEAPKEETSAEIQQVAQAEPEVKNDGGKEQTEET